jgi:hypothetical protein
MKTTINSITTIRQIIEAANPRSAWNKGVKAYALDLIDSIPDNVEYGNTDSLMADLLNGASNWDQYSWGGCSLIYDRDIAIRLCTPSELKKTRNGERRPNDREMWLDTQTRALRQAWFQIMRAAEGKSLLF